MMPRLSLVCGRPKVCPSSWQTAPLVVAAISLVAERLRIDRAHEAERHPAADVNERVVLVERMRQPLERVARAPRQQLVGDLFARPELGRRNAGELAQDPAVMRALSTSNRRGTAVMMVGFASIMSCARLSSPVA